MRAALHTPAQFRIRQRVAGFKLHKQKPRHAGRGLGVFLIEWIGQRRRLAKPRPAKPSPRSNTVVGSGTDVSVTTTLTSPALLVHS